MATTEEFIKYVCKQIEGTGEVRYRKMFGEYMVYLNDKPIFTVCDNTVYVKKLEEVADLLGAAEVGKPYEMAKEHYILDIDNQDLSKQVALQLDKVIPVPKPRKRKCLRLEGSNFRLGGIAPISRAVPSFRVSMRLAVLVAWQKGN